MMKHKEKFMMFVFLNAIARDLSRKSSDSMIVTQAADRIPEGNIPVNPLNAAKVFVAHADGVIKPFRWMRSVPLR